MTTETADSLRTWAESMRTMETVAKAHGLRVSDIRSRGKHRNLVAVRRAVAVALTALGLSSVEVGMVMHRHHTSILHLLGRLS